VRVSQKFTILSLVFCLFWLPSVAAASAKVAVFPLQELGDGRNQVNLPFTRALVERLTKSGNDVVSLDTVIAFMAHNRIRTVGRLETFYISRVREDLGAAFVLLGTVTQEKKIPEASFGLTLSLVRTNDARTVWSYVGSFSTSDERRILGIDEPQSVADLHPLLLEDISGRWPWKIINEIQQAGSISIDSMALGPAQVRPGGEVHARVRLRDVWRAGHAPRVFFKADDQLYPATGSDDGHTFKATWVAGEKDGNFPVTLVLQWPLYGRTENSMLGTYVVDSTEPLFDIDLRGVTLKDGKPVFHQSVVIVPRLLVHKPLARWRLSFHSEETGRQVGALDGRGNLPERFIWQGRGQEGVEPDGTYKVVLKAWDEAGNSASASREVVLDRSIPQVKMSLSKSDDGMVVQLDDQGKVPLSYWRMEMWTKEGKFLTQAEGKKLPVKIGVDLSEADRNQTIQGFVIVRDVLGTRVRRKVEDLLPKLTPKPKAEKKKPAGLSKSWVDEF
jgi:TolB-like protein